MCEPAIRQMEKTLKAYAFANQHIETTLR